MTNPLIPLNGDTPFLFHSTKTVRLRMHVELFLDDGVHKRSVLYIGTPLVDQSDIDDVEFYTFLLIKTQSFL